MARTNTHPPPDIAGYPMGGAKKTVSQTGATVWTAGAENDDARRHPPSCASAIWCDGTEPATRRGWYLLWPPVNGMGTRIVGPMIAGGRQLMDELCAYHESELNTDPDTVQPDLDRIVLAAVQERVTETSRRIAEYNAHRRRSAATHPRLMAEMEEAADALREWKLVTN
ncbi:MAG: hypothetical protein OXG35_13485 [Acidobacteria bacterium]|nr:hypothetical protein [Acidobacteriota bacterium]